MAKRKIIARRCEKYFVNVENNNQVSFMITISEGSTWNLLIDPGINNGWALIERKNITIRLSEEELDYIFGIRKEYKE